MTGIELITAERLRQVEKEGCSSEHDAHHTLGELVDAAICYAAYEPIYRLKSTFQHGRPNGYALFDPWPWESKWDNRQKHARIKRLTIAGALIAAEIDRITDKHS